MKISPWWLDPRLATLIGKPDHAERRAIEPVLEDVIRQVLDVGSDPLRVVYLDRHAPWARDLARGLHWLALGLSPEPSTAEMLDILADRPLTDEQRRRFTDDIDVAYALTYHRHIDTVAGHGASATISVASLRANRPWLDTLLLGWRLHLAVELLRLTRSDSRLD